MADTFTSALKARKIEQGAYNNSYAARFNEDMVDIFDAGIAGVLEIDIGSSTTHALEAMQNGTLSDSHYRHLRFVGTPASAVTVTVPASVNTDKEYIVENQTGQLLTFKYAATAGQSIPDGQLRHVLADGADIHPFRAENRRTAAEIAASAVTADCGHAPGVFTRYRGTVASSAATNTTALQDALDSNQTVEIHERGTHLFNDSILYNTNNRIVGKGADTILKWNVTSKSLLKPAVAATVRSYNFGMRDLTIDNTARTNAGVIALDCDNLSLAMFENMIVKNVETGCKLWSSNGNGLVDGSYYNVFNGINFLTVDDGIVLAELGNENKFVACRVGDCVNGVIGDDNSSNFFDGIAIEAFTGYAVDLGATAPALYYCFIKPRIEGGPTGFRLDNADARSTTIIAPHFQTIATANFDPAAIGLDTNIISGEINSPELRANVYALGQGGLDNAQWAIIKATATSDVSIRNAADSGFADLRASDIYAARYFRTAGAAFGAASTVTFGNVTQTTVGAAGAASALPATPSGYLRFFVGTTEFVLPYYARV
jgi:hypothetical protein